MVRSMPGSGPTPSGNMLTTMTKKNCAVSQSPRRRAASNTSRRMTVNRNFSIDITHARSTRKQAVLPAREVVVQSR